MYIAATAILFDCDGVLVNSAETINASWTRWSHFYGLDPALTLRSVKGSRAVDVVATLLPRWQVSDGVTRINEYELEDARRVRPMAGASDLLSAVPDNAKAIVTSATQALATSRLQSAGLPIPSVIISADDVTHGKPAPDPYLAAADRLRVHPIDTIVIEDSCTGITAARAAGVGYLIVVGSHKDTDYHGISIKDLTGLCWDICGGLVLSHTLDDDHSPADLA